MLNCASFVYAHTHLRLLLSDHLACVLPEFGIHCLQLLGRLERARERVFLRGNRSEGVEVGR